MGRHGSGKSNRKGMTLTDLYGMFPDDDTAREWFEANVWKDGRTCGLCGSGNTMLSKHPTMPYRCVDCRRYFSVKVGTVMERSRISYQHWAMVTYLFATNLKGVSSMKIHRDLGITQRSAWFMVHRLRESWKSLARVSDMKGPVEVDETYVEGLEKNKHKDKKGKNKKAMVIGIKDRDTNKVSVEVLPEATKARMAHFIDEHKANNAKIYTDENPTYKGMNDHESVNHSAGQYVRGMAHTNGLESFWSMLDRGYGGTYHHLSQKHLPRYINEFAGRHNVRSMDTVDMMVALVRGMVGKRLTYEDLIGKGQC